MPTGVAQRIRHAARVMGQQKWLILGIATAFFVIGGITQPEPEPEYTAFAEVDTGGVQEQVLLLYSYGSKDEHPKYRLQREAQQALGPEVITRAYLKLGGIPRGVEIEAAPAGLTGHLAISVTSTDRVLAARVANVVAAEFVARRNAEYRTRIYEISRELRQSRAGVGEPPAGISFFADVFRYATSRYQTRLDLLKRLAKPAVFSRRATPPGAPKPRLPFPGLLLTLGLSVGVAAAFLREALRQRREDPRLAATEAGLEPLGLVEDPEGGLLASVATGDGTRPARVAVCGLRPGDRPLATALGMAGAVAEQGERVLLVETDLPRPRLAQRLGLPAQPGLGGVLAGTATPSSALLPTRTPDGLPGPVLLPGGKARPAPPAGCGPVLEEVAAGFDLVVVVVPSPLESAELTLLAPWLDRIVVVSERERRGDDELRAVRRALQPLGVPSGLVLCDEAVERTLSPGRLRAAEPSLAGAVG